MMQQVILVIHFLLAFGIIGLVLLQHGKGAEVGASFGSGASQTLFGSQGSTSFLAKFTTLLAIGFAISSLSLSYLNGRHQHAPTILEQIEAQQAKELPGLPTTAVEPDEVIEDSKPANIGDLPSDAIKQHTDSKKTNTGINKELDDKE